MQGTGKCPGRGHAERGRSVRGAYRTPGPQSMLGAVGDGVGCWPSGRDGPRVPDCVWARSCDRVPSKGPVGWRDPNRFTRLFWPWKQRGPPAVRTGDGGVSGRGGLSEKPGEFSHHWGVDAAGSRGGEWVSGWKLGLGWARAWVLRSAGARGPPRPSSWGEYRAGGRDPMTPIGDGGLGHRARGGRREQAQEQSEEAPAGATLEKGLSC